VSATDGWVHVTHPETGGQALIPDDEAVTAMYVGRGWDVSDQVPAELDPDAQDTGAVPAPPAPTEAPAEVAPEQPAAKPAKNTRTAGPADEKTGE
jgi:hypothetical protein